MVPVGVWTAVTVAPGSTPPCWSVTMPLIVPVVTVWPCAGCAHAINATARYTTDIRMECIMDSRKTD